MVALITWSATMDLVRGIRVNSQTIETLNTELALLGTATPTVKWNQQPWVPEQTHTLQFLITYRNTATKGIESSPAQCLMNRRTRTLLPTTKTLLQPRAHRVSGISNNWISDNFNSLATTISMLMTYPRSKKVMSYVWSHSSWEIKSGKKGTIT